ncbi:phospholipase A2 inhibitor and Ly6/PLAUR domain-containing protein-like [Discoglossus pictus]
MSPSLAVLWLLSAVLGEAFSLECLHCNGTGGTSCTPSLKICPIGQDQCVTTYSEGNLTLIFIAKPSQFVQKSCGVQADCDRSFSMTTNNTEQTSRTKCCTTKGCTTQVSLIPKSLSKNGVMCESCFERGEKCNSIGQIECTGLETSCIQYTANIIHATNNYMVTAKGCATPTMCTMGTKSIFPGANVTVTHWVCSQAPSFLPSILFPVMSGLLWLKLLS